MELTDRVDSVKGIGEKTKKLFEKVNVFTVGELLSYYPRDYESFAAPAPVSELKAGTVGVIEAAVSRFSEVRRGTKTVLSCQAKDPSGSVALTWFNQPYLKSTLSMGYRYIFRGRVVKKGNALVMEQPKPYKREDYQRLRAALQPVYPLTKGLTNTIISKSIKQVLALSEELPEYLPAGVRRQFGIPKKIHTVTEVHFPKSRETMLEARRALVFEEFFLFSLFLRELSGQKETLRSMFLFSEVPECGELLDSLPFSLTGDQQKVWEEIRRDLTSGRVMVRLIQGDVGSGKTILAVLALLMTVKNGCQGCLMVPTEVLARQHYESLCRMLSRFGVRVTLLVGSMGAKEKREAYQKMKAQETDIIVGTHALIQEKAEYARLGLVITDEQHRFGVKQREKLSEKGKGTAAEAVTDTKMDETASVEEAGVDQGVGTQPHILVMSATPIPRTLAMMLYGDMDLSIIQELPAERLPIKNCVVGQEYRPTAYRFIAKQVAEGRQAYIICPMVEESETTDAENVTDYTEKLKEAIGGACRVEALHGKMKPAQKNEIMERFSSGEIQVLVSTTVVEVGVNVPNATVMMIENAERFGLAQLHQLRGRVGRGAYQSYCIIMSGNDSKETMERLEILNKSNDGFFIASEDLRLRGPGDLFGIRQSGDMNFKIGDIYQDASVLKEANEAAGLLPAAKRREIIDLMYANGANNVFLFLNVYSTI